MRNTDLISRKALLDELKEELEWERAQSVPMTATSAFKIAMRRTKKAPAMDAVEVVRCKDCAEYIPWMNGQRICGRVGSYYGGTDPDDYCSKGRKA